jgi:hypothetical protein
VFFQLLDSKKECKAICVNNSIIETNFPDLTATWDYNPNFDLPNIEYAKLYCAGLSLDDACPVELKSIWLASSQKIKAFLKSFSESKVLLTDNCVYDMIPKKYLLEHFSLKNEITEYVITNYEKPKNYDFLLSLQRLTASIESKKLNLDFDVLSENLGSYKYRRFRTMAKRKNVVSYNIFGTKTGRLATNKNSFPILTLNKEFRETLKPKNDYFVELDFNAAELRTLLALAGQEQPTQDLHDWNIQNVFKKDMSREDAKKRIFSWLYNPASVDSELSKIYARDTVRKKYHSDGYVNTIFHRVIPADDHHALNYIIQSTTSDLFLTQAIKLWKILKDKKSQIAFCIHDSLVIDYSVEDGEMLTEIVEIFSDTDLGRYKINVKYGKDFKNMFFVKKQAN